MKRWVIWAGLLKFTFTTSRQSALPRRAHEHGTRRARARLRPIMDALDDEEADDDFSSFGQAAGTASASVTASVDDEYDTGES